MDKFHRALLVIASILCVWVIVDMSAKPPRPPIIPLVTIVPAAGVASTDFELYCTGFSPSGRVNAEVLNLLSLRPAPQADAAGKLTILLNSDGWAPGDYTCRVTDLSTQIHIDGNIRILSPPPSPAQANVVNDDSASTTGWPEEQNGDYESKYENGRYSISIGDTDDQFPIINKNFGEFTDFIAEMDVGRSGRDYSKPLFTNFRAAGFVFHADSDGNGVAFLVNTEGFYTLNQGLYTQLIPRTDTPEIKTNQGNNYYQTLPVINHLKVSVTGKTVVLNINGDIVGQYTDLPAGSGFIGVIVQGNNSQVYFENLSIQRR